MSLQKILRIRNKQMVQADPDIAFLLSELERMQEENRKLREERDRCTESNLCRECANKAIDGYKSEIQSAQQDKES